MKTKTSSRLSKKVVEMPITSEKITSQKLNRPSKKFIILALLILIGGILILGAKKYKNLIIVGKVNGRPVTRLELEVALNSRYGKQTFDDLASNILVQQLAAKNEVTVSDDEVSQEIEATSVRLGGKEALTATLDRMGYTTERLRDEMRIQVLVKKLAEKVLKVEVADAEIQKFFDDNKTLFPDKTFDEVKEDIKQNLLQQKNQQEFATWFADQKKNAEIQSYL
jgi:parvulin-like peptidyl-prolyl isomerase